jgi:hypothetical protein
MVCSAGERRRQVTSAALPCVGNVKNDDAALIERLNSV